MQEALHDRATLLAFCIRLDVQFICLYTP